MGKTVLPPSLVSKLGEIPCCGKPLRALTTTLIWKTDEGEHG